MTDHLKALNVRLFNERARLALAKTAKERELRSVFVAQIEKEIAGEVEFLGLTDTPNDNLTDDELLAELIA